LTTISTSAATSCRDWATPATVNLGRDEGLALCQIAV
jgi:hypothetical protein